MALDSILSTPVVSPPPAKSSSSQSRSSASSHSSFGAEGSSDSASTQSSSSSNGANTSDNGNSTRNSGQNASTRNNAASKQGQNSASQSQKAASSSQSQQSSSTNQAQSANAASNGKAGAAQSNTTPGTSFLEALAQSQADAQDSATATTTSSTTPLVTTGKGKGKAKDDGSTNSAASFGFLSQSLVAAMAGIQQTSPTQSTTDGGDSVDGVSLSSGTTAQTLTASLMENTAEDLKAQGDNGSSTGNSSTAGATDTTGANAAAAANFQSHLGISSQSQTQATQNAANTQVNSPVGSSGFADEVGDKITWMAHQGVQSASLQMTPEHMGPVEVKISVQDGSATVSINAAHADTRAALEQALPKLHEMFSSQGMNLTDASVSQQFTRGQAQKQGVKAVGSVGSVSDEASSPVVSVTSARLGLVDTYA